MVKRWGNDRRFTGEKRKAIGRYDPTVSSFVLCPDLALRIVL